MPVSDSAVRIELTCGHTITVDAEFEALARSRKWRYRKSGGSAGALHYVCAATDNRQLFLHREIMDAERGQIDRVENLRFVTAEQNMRNAGARPKGGSKASRFKGVVRSRRRWMALIRADKRQVYLGTFDIEAAAAFAYDMASLAMHGDYGRRNFLPMVN